MIQSPSRLMRRVGGAAVFASLVLASTASMAQQSPALDRISVWLGGYYAKTDTNIGASDPSGQFKGNVNLENDLGFRDHTTTPRAKFDFLIGDSQGFSFDYYSINRTRTKTLSDAISYGGNDYSASASVRGKLDFDFGSAAYRWWFGHENDVFGLGLGAAYYRVRAGISGEASFDGESVGQASTSGNAGAWAPLLQLGWRHSFNDQWRMYFDASGVRKNGGQLNGHIYNGALGVEYFPWKNVGFGAEYSYTKIRLNQDKRYYDADLDMKLTGPSLFVRLRF